MTDSSGVKVEKPEKPEKPKKIDAIIIGQSEIVRYEEYSRLPLDRIEHFKELVQLRMLYLEGRFCSHLDVLNFARHGKFFSDGSYPERRKLLNIWNLPGLSSLLVASAAIHHGFNVKVINFFDSEFDRFVELYESQEIPPLVGVSTTFYLSYSEVKRILNKLQAYDSKMKVVLGGAFSNEQTINKKLSDFEAPMRKYGVTYLLHAFNSDEDFPSLLRAHQAKAGFSQVPNLAYFDENGGFQLTSKLWHNPTLVSKPMLWKQVDLSFVNQTIQLRSASGCPFACSFCTYPETAGGHFTLELELVEKQLQDIRDLGFVKRIIFIDDTFNVPITRFKKILQILKKFDFEWFSFLRVQYVDDEIARLMKESGCRGVYLGLESADDQVLKNMNKKVTNQAFRAGLEHLNRHEITTFAAYVIGFPGETIETIEKNIKFLKDCSIDFYSTKEFYYMQHAAVHLKRAEYGLEGLGNNWKHNTMDSKTATEMKIHMFREIKDSLFIDPDTSLWYLAFLYDQGFSISTIKELQKELNAMTLLELDGNFGQKEAYLDRIRSLMHLHQSFPTHPQSHLP